MLRRTFLLGTAAALATRTQSGSLAYVQDGTLWIKRPPDGTARALAAGNAISAPKFSPSGRWILFREGDDLLRLVSTDGTRARSWVASGQWLPDREELAVYLGEESNRTLILGEHDNWNSPLRTLTDPLGTVSPDGRLRAWESSSGDATRLFLGPLAETDEPRLIAETKEGGFQIFGFARDGSRILYWMTDEDGANVRSYGLDFYMAGGVEQKHSLALVDISDDLNPKLHPITGPLVSTVHPAWSPDGRQLVWARDGSHILFGRRDERDARSLWLMRSDGSDPHEVAGPFPSDTGWSDLFDWSFR